MQEFFWINQNYFQIKKIKVYEDLDAVTVPTYKEANKIYDICYLGRLSKPKGIIDLLKIIKLLINDNYKPHIAIIGSYNSKIIRTIKRQLVKYKLNPELFEFFGYVGNNKKYDIMQHSKIFISLSYEEGWSISVMEAAALEIPIVAYNLPAYSYLNGNFYSAPIGDLNAIKLLIEKLLDNINISKDIAHKAKFFVSKYNYEEIAQEQLEYFSDFITNY